MKAENVEDIYELTPVQKGMLFHCLYASESALYFFNHTLTLHGNPNVEAFEQAWQQVVDRHTVLRTGFFWEDIDNPLQVVYKHVKITLSQYDWRGIEEAEQQERLKSFLESDRKLGFDFSQPCLMRLTLIRLADERYEFIWSNHHIIIDGWSCPIILEECLQIYEALCEYKNATLALARPFRDYIDWLQQQNIAKTENFWRQALQGVKAPTPLTYIENNQLSNQQERYDEERIQLSAATTKLLLSFATKNHLTLATLVHGIWSILLSRYTCRNNIIYGCTVTGRPVDLAEVDSIVGMFINTLPINVKLNTEQQLLSWLQDFQTQLVEVRHHEYTPLTQIQGWTEVPRNLPLFETIVVVENLPISQFVSNWKGNIQFESTGTYYRNNYPLNLVIYPATEIIVAISYDSRRFDIATITGIIRDFQTLLQQIMTNPYIPIKDLSFLIPQQQKITTALQEEALFDLELAPMF
ncbi:condensation domain-containing protein [Nostoc sp. CHAB 5836]|uniref:condensation domain-containing protein n=1 Tax=Nostoc sp. CHAB 5836 TaxID=2780404 RepID=UPI001E614ED6|nr:condensation domain-containing protein [Nostoc sp. CHAB 5836]MCC5616016.1 condensation domain-containing protein [Nostoc sp. CHAB 5836]